ncbi:hypothetical protein [Plesiomonas shigelloides]|uniref:hypothetical protein n=1 Tax=Plesiomonas shigelloides TaxID=703 RepID=UPI00387F1428
MGRARVINRSGEHLGFYDVTKIKTRADDSINLLYSRKNPDFTSYFVGMSYEEVLAERDLALRENDLMYSLLLLTCIEAMLRLDADTRSSRKLKDKLSVALGVYHPRARLDEDIINVRMATEDKALRRHYLFLKECFQYRHWLAHGRYWVPRGSASINFDSIVLMMTTLMANSTFIE